MRLSVGTRWTLRYSLAMLATTVVLALIVFDRVERRFQQDAEMLLDLQVEEVRVALEHHPDPQDLEAWLDQKLVAGGREVGLGVALYDAENRVRIAKGVLAQQPQALTLRYLQSMIDISAEKSSTILFPIPIDLMVAFKDMVDKQKNA